MRVCLRSWYVSDWHRYTSANKPVPKGLEKKIPGAPENETPVHLRKRQIFSHNFSSYRDGETSADRKSE